MATAIKIGCKMDKLDLKTPDFTDENIQKLSELFPNCVTESADGKSIDFDLLKQELSHHIIEGNKERYQLSWPGKAKSLVTANTPINKTLRPNRKESKDFDKTENLFIEGDNLDILKLLQETYLGKVKMIYIDPPYNTGSDFVYKDNFTQDKAEYDENVGNIDEEGGRLVSNPDSNGRYHSDWLSMMYPRLKLAKNLLSEDGVIFISIDDNEIHNLRKICDEVFGELNFLNTIAVKMSEATGVKMAHVNKRLPKLKEYILLYKKNMAYITPPAVSKEKWDSEYKHLVCGVTKDELDLVKSIMSMEHVNDTDISVADKICAKIRLQSTEQLFSGDISFSEEEKTITLIDNAWRIVRDVATTGGAKNIADTKKKETNAPFFLITTPRKKVYLIKRDYSESADQPRIKMLFADSYLTVNPGDFWQDIKTTGLDNEGDVDFNNGKKPIKLISRMLQIITKENDLILDFFSGSSSTAHAVMQLNAKDGGHRKFIMSQIPEDTDKKSEAFKAGYGTVSEIGKERIRRAGEKIKNDNTDKEDIDNLDVGFRVLKVDSSNMKDIYYTPNSTKQSDILDLAKNIKDDRSDEDLLFQVLLDWGIDLSVKIERKEISSRAVYFADDDYLAACFETNLDESFVKEVIKCAPRKVVLRDSGFKSSSIKINVEQLFKQANIEVKVI